MEHLTAAYLEAIKLWSVTRTQRDLTKDEVMCYNQILATVRSHARLVELNVQKEIDRVVNDNWSDSTSL